MLRGNTDIFLTLANAINSLSKLEFNKLEKYLRSAHISGITPENETVIFDAIGELNPSISKVIKLAINTRLNRNVDIEAEIADGINKGLINLETLKKIQRIANLFTPFTHYTDYGIWIVNTFRSLDTVIKNQSKKRLKELNDHIEAYRAAVFLKKNFPINTKKDSLMDEMRSEIVTRLNTIWPNTGSSQKDLAIVVLDEMDPKLKAKTYKNYQFVMNHAQFGGQPFKDDVDLKIRMVKHKTTELIKSKQGLFQSKSNKIMLKQVSERLDHSDRLKDIKKLLDKIQTEYTPRQGILFSFANYIRSMWGAKIEKKDTDTYKKITNIKTSYNLSKSCK